MGDQKTLAASKKKTWLIIIGVLSCVGCLCICITSLGIAFYLRDDTPDGFSGKSSGRLEISSLSDNGDISGVYFLERGLDKKQIFFTVDQRGNAFYNLDGDPAGPLKIQFTAENTVEIQWNKQSWDGNGPLSATEKASLVAAFESDLGQGLTSIPLQAACRSDSDLTPGQMAALLVPLQMKYKYLVSNRSGLAEELIQEYPCSSSEHGLSSGLGSNLVQFTISAPVPVVPGFFPFDETGAIEGEFSTTGSNKSACARYYDTSLDLQDPVRSTFSDPPAFDAPGPCGALCRGACGADCDPDNCSFSKENRCEKDENGQNTGNVFRVVVFECGLHQGCINHDDCYDRCNLANGCNTWSAAFCRHAITSNPTQVQAGFCDQTAIVEEGPIDPALWMHGFGDMPLRKTYVYVDEEYGSYYNPGGCPIGEESPQPTEERVPTPTGEYHYQGSYTSTTGNCVDSGEFALHLYPDGNATARWRKTADSCSENFRPSSFWNSSYGSHQDGEFEIPFNTLFTLEGSYDEYGMTAYTSQNGTTFSADATPDLTP